MAGTCEPQALRPYRVTFITIVPSPYQRDLFAALAERTELQIAVYYLESSAPDSPWPERPLREFERILPGSWFPVGKARVHFNWSLPDLRDSEFVILSSFTSITGQWLMRYSLRGKPWIFWGERLTEGQGLKGKVRKILIEPMKRARCIVGIGKAAESDYRRRIPHLPHFSIPYHCNLEPFLAIDRLTAADRPLTFLFCGQMIRRKGVDVLLAAFERLILEGVEARLLLVGREAGLPMFLEQIGQEARTWIEYAGFQPPEQLATYFSRADVFVLPSRYDGWGVVVNQAMAAGMPIVVSDAVGAGMEYVSSGVNGWCVPVGNVEALHIALRRFVDDPELVRQWGQAARERAETLTPKMGAEKWVRVFRTLKNRRGPQTSNSERSGHSQSVGDGSSG